MHRRFCPSCGTHLFSEAESRPHLVIVRNGVRLRLIREDAVPESPGRLSRLVKRSIVIGAPLDPHESPAEWSGDISEVAEPVGAYVPRKRPRGRR